MSAISGSLSAVFQRDAAREANRANREAVDMANQANLGLSLYGRGARLGGRVAPELRGLAAAVLPYYMGTSEETMGRSAADTAMALQSIYGSPELEIADYRNLIDTTYQPSMDANAELARRLASGELTQQMVAELAPVAQARMQVAEGKKSAALEQLSETLADIDAIQSKKGFIGDNYGTRMMKFNARRGIMGQAAADIGQANLENALAEAATRESGRQKQFAGINLPAQLAESAVGLRQLPTSATARRFQTSMAPLSFFNLGTHNFTPFQRYDQEAPTQSTLGILAGGSAAVGNAGLNYLMQRDLQNRIKKTQTPAWSPPANDYSWLNYLGAGAGSGAPAGTVNWGDASYAPIF